jgi:hypothetical protein
MKPKGENTFIRKPHVDGKARLAVVQLYSWVHARAAMDGKGRDAASKHPIDGTRVDDDRAGPDRGTDAALIVAEAYAVGAIADEPAIGALHLAKQGTDRPWFCCGGSRTSRWHGPAPHDPPSMAACWMLDACMHAALLAWCPTLRPTYLTFRLPPTADGDTHNRCGRWIKICIG